MRISPKGINLIVKFEGEILKVYPDPVGLPTLGVGHLLTKAELKQYPLHTPISRQLSRQFLAQDLERFEIALDRLVTVKLTQNQYDALCSLIFNIGIGNFTKSTLLKKLNNKDYQGAADAFMSWVKAKGQVLPGLVTRRKAERKLFLTPDPKPAVSADSEPAPTEGGEAQTNQPESPSTSSFSVMGAIDMFLGGVDKASDAEVRIGRSTWTKVLGSKALGLFMLAVSFLLNNWEITVAGLALVVIGAFILWRRRRGVKKVRSEIS